MIRYNTRDWFGTTFRLHRADTFIKLLPLILLIAAYSWAVAYFELHLHTPNDGSYLKNLSMMHTLLGLVLSLLIVFRTNTAYDRWWEGRKLWGSLTNNSRSLAIKISAMIPPEDRDTLTFFREIIPAFAIALRNHLRDEHTRIELFDDKRSVHLKPLAEDRHIPNQIVEMMVKRVGDLHRKNVLSGESWIILNTDLQAFTDILGGCERIKNTPIPFSYSAFIKKFIFIYVLTLPFGFVLSLGYMVVPVVSLVFYVLGSLELIGEEIEDPFGGDPNDVPTDKIAGNIQNNVREILPYEQIITS